MRPAIRAILQDRAAGITAGHIAARFHATVAEVIVAFCRQLARETGLDRVCLSGGTFQNIRLLEAVITGLHKAGLQPFWHHQVPPNDGGLALGQAVIAGRLAQDSSLI